MHVLIKLDRHRKHKDTYQSSLKALGKKQEQAKNPWTQDDRALNSNHKIIQKSWKQNLITKEARILGPKHQKTIKKYLTTMVVNEYLLFTLLLNPQNLAQCQKNIG